MKALIDDARQRDLTLMSLRASEATIYGRYGFGVAGEYCDVTIDPARVRPLAGVSIDGSFRMLDSNEIVDVVAPLYDRIAHRRPGVVTRPLPWSTRMFRSAVERTEPSFVVVHLDGGGEPDGYVHYDVKWSDGMNSGSTGWGEVHDLFGATDAIELALWQYLLDTDLVTRWTAIGRPTDDLVRLAARDRRGYRQTAVQDEQWVRLVDVDAALRGRSYNDTSESVSIQVTDPLIPQNNGSWRVGAGGAERTEQAPQLSVGVETISAAYLGGPSWASLAGLGAVGGGDPAAIAVADVLFASRPLPFCGTFF